MTRNDFYRTKILSTAQCFGVSIHLATENAHQLTAAVNGQIKIWEHDCLEHLCREFRAWCLSL